MQRRAAQPPQAPEQAPQSEGEGSGVSELISRINSDLLQLSEVFSGVNELPPELAQKVEGLAGSYREIMQQVMAAIKGGASQGGAMPAPGSSGPKPVAPQV
jgi:hypothetical protein